MKKETSFFKCFYFYFYELNMKKETSNYYTRLLETKGNKNEKLVQACCMYMIDHEERNFIFQMFFYFIIIIIIIMN